MEGEDWVRRDDAHRVHITLSANADNVHRIQGGSRAWNGSQLNEASCWVTWL